MTSGDGINATAVGAGDGIEGVAVGAGNFGLKATLQTDVIGSDQLAASAVAEIQAGLATSAALATVQADTDDIQTRLPAALVGGRMDSSVGAMATNTLTADALAADALAEIKTQVTDALNVDTYAEVGQEAPAATQTIRKMLGLLYKGWRNRATQTATQYSLFNDDATTIGQKATVSDDGTTFDRNEVGTGP